VALKLLDQVVSQIGSCRGVEQVKERADGALMGDAAVLGTEPVVAAEERFETKIGANFLIAGNSYRRESAIFRSFVRIAGGRALGNKLPQRV
jgi:hypothetical protein